MKSPPSTVNGIAAPPATGPDGSMYNPVLDDARVREKDHKATEQRVFTSSRSSSPGQQQEMTQADYDALTPEARAAVDFNGMLSRAINQDKSEELLQLDKDRSGTVSVREATEGGMDTASYRSALGKIFGRESVDDDAFAPATLGLINQLELSDSLGTIEEYLSGSAYVTEKDLKSSGARGAVQGPMIATTSKNQQARDNLVGKVAAGMANLERTLQGGRVVVGGVGLTPSVRGIDNSQRDALVQNMAESLLLDDRLTTLGLTGQGGRYDAASGVNVSPLVDPVEAQRMLDYENVFQSALNNGWTLESMKDTAALKRLGFTEGTGIEIDDWSDYIARREQTANSAGRTMEQDLMDQIAGVAGTATEGTGG